MTGLLLIAAEELDMNLEQLVFVRHDTNVSPDTGGTFGSSSIAIAGGELRSACAAARGALLELASAQLGVPVASLSVSGGVVSGNGRSVELRRARRGQAARRRAALPDPPARPGRLEAGRAVPPRRDRRVSRVSTSRRRLPGTYVYIHGVRVPGMLHARLVRPLGQGATAMARWPGSSRSTSARSRTSAMPARAAGRPARGPRNPGVRRDPGCHEPPGRLPRSTGDLGERRSLRRDARARCGGRGSGADPGAPGRCRLGARAQPRIRSPRATPTTSRGTCRSARVAPSPM